MAEKPPSAEPEIPSAVQAPPPAPPPAAGILMRGTPVAPGLALGQVHRKDYDLLRASARRVPLDQVEGELNRFQRSLFESRRQLEDLKSRLEGRVPADHVRILDTHVALLRDSVFLSDVENLIINEQMTLDAAIGKVVADFDRIFRLVQSETLRERAVDLRDVGIRVLRNLERGASDGQAAEPPADYVLVAKELSIVDMFNLENEHVLGILTEGGALTSHAAILARSMRIPAVSGIAGLLEAVKEGDFVLLDASEGTVRINPDEVVRTQFAQQKARPREDARPEGVPAWARRPPRTHEGHTVGVTASCGSLPEVDQASALGMQGVGLYRTELLYLVDREQPSLESLVAHYASVLSHAQGHPVTFRLLHVDSSLEVPYLHPQRELNPSLGHAGVRILLAHEPVLRRQMQALLRAAPDGPEARVRIAVPFVTDCGDLRRVKELLFEERYALRKAGASFQDHVELGAVIETPVAALGAAELAREADFLTISLDSLLQYLLAADRENHELRNWFEPLHPFVIRTLVQVCDAAELAGRPLSVFGVTAVAPANLPFLLGAGLRHFCVPPVALQEFVETLSAIDLRTARRSATLASRAACQAETQTLVEGYRHGYARP